jgi:phosphohistidine swiveling domain-containing protein
MSRLISLGDPAALDPALVGIKASLLAGALQRGHPVLPGLIVPVAESRLAARAALSALAAGDMGAARRRAAGAAIEPSLLGALSGVGALGDSLIARSSTNLDDDGRWSGAFASVAELSPPEIAIGVRSCWASVFSPDSLARAELAGLAFGAVEVAVLIQRQVTPAAGGWAKVGAGSVSVAAVRGHPGRLFAGWADGIQAEFTSDGSLLGPVQSLLVDKELLTRAARLAQRLYEQFGARRLEWAVEDGRVIILQIGPAEADRYPTESDTPDVFRARAYRRLASVLIRRRGPLADLLLAPWAAAAPNRIRSLPSAGGPKALFDSAKRLSLDLSRTVQHACGIERDIMIDRLAAGDRDTAECLSKVTIDGESAGQLLGAVEELGKALVARRLIGDPRAVWWQSEQWVGEAVHREAAVPPAAQRPVDRWGDVLFCTTKQHGEHKAGHGASEGRAVGNLVRVDNASDAGRLRAGDILLTSQPFPSLAPLLWKASGLIALAGSPAAHLCEVARSLHVPAVVSVPMPTSGRDPVVALDGSSGGVWHWDER